MALKLTLPPVYVPVSIPAIIFASSPKRLSGFNKYQDKIIPQVVAKDPRIKRPTIGRPAFLIDVILTFSNK